MKDSCTKERISIVDNSIFLGYLLLNKYEFNILLKNGSISFMIIPKLSFICYEKSEISTFINIKKITFYIKEKNIVSCKAEDLVDFIGDNHFLGR